MSEPQCFAIVAYSNPGIYGRDAAGQPWATFETIGGQHPCVVCGTLISRGWMRGKCGEECIYICSSHVQIEWETDTPNRSNVCTN